MKKEFSAVAQTTMLSLFFSLTILAKIPKWKRYRDNELSAKERLARVAKPNKRREGFLERARKATAARLRKLINSRRNR